VLAYMLALRQSSANRRQSPTAEDDDPNGEILRIDTPNQVPLSAPVPAFESYCRLTETLHLECLPAWATATALRYGVWCHAILCYEIFDGYLWQN